MFRWLKRPAPIAPSAAVTRDLRGDDWHVRLDLTPQVLSLAIPTEITRNEGEEELAPTCDQRDWLGDGFVSASMLAVEAKLFDDGLIAAAELAAQSRKANLLAPLVHAAPLIAAAARLGGMDLPLSAESQRITADFLANPLASKPLGFYTWSDALGRIFQQDRLLQQQLTPSDARALIDILDAVPAAKAAYGDYRAFVQRLTNPSVTDKPDLSDPAGRCFFPPSRSHEADLVNRLYRDRPIPDGFSLADEMMKRVRDGSLTLDPTEASGWYDFQTWALEPLIAPDRMPEGARLRMDDKYREQLDELFKAILSLTRETHVKQLEVVFVGAAGGRWPRRTVIPVAPELTVEPVVTYYRRRARGYAFVREVLESLGPLHAMRRVTAGGPVARPLDDELAETAAIFEGAAAVAGRELGMQAATGSEVERFREWANRRKTDSDVRMMVPVFYDVGRGQTKVWAILGWATRRLEVSFATPPAVQVITGRPRIDFCPAFKQIAYPVFAEAYVSRLLDRDEFRAHCDRYRTRTRILEHL
jgi:hypothetical protein